MKITTRLFTLAALVSSVTSAQALVTLAYDDASDATYTGGNVHGLNGGFGFNAWSATPTSNSGNAGNFQFTSSQNGNGASGDIDTASKAWGMYANSGNTSSLVRNFNVPMSGYRKISLEFDNGWLDQGSEAFVQIGVYQFGFTGGGTEYWFDKGLGRQNVGMGFSADGFVITLQILNNGNYIFNAVNKATNAVYGNANTGGVMPSFIMSSNVNAGGGSGNNSYINKLKIEAVPEPSTMLAVAAGLGVILVRRRK